jgi:acyl carrier protein
MGREAIDVQTFARNLERYLDNPSPTGLDLKTRFQDLPGWTSLQALIVVAGFETDYGVTVSEDEFREANTVHDLYSVVVRRMAE